MTRRNTLIASATAAVLVAAALVFAQDDYRYIDKITELFIGPSSDGNVKLRLEHITSADVIGTDANGDVIDASSSLPDGPTGGTGYIQYDDGSGGHASDAQLQWDSSSNTLEVGDTSTDGAVTTFGAGDLIAHIAQVDSTANSNRKWLVKWVSASNALILYSGAPTSLSTNTIIVTSGGCQSGGTNGVAVTDTCFEDNQKITQIGPTGIVSFGGFQVNGGDAATQNIVPSADSTYDLGSSAAYWDELYVDDIIVNEGNVEPLADSTNDLGTSSLYWDECFCDDYEIGDGRINTPAIGHVYEFYCNTRIGTGDNYCDFESAIQMDPITGAGDYEYKLPYGGSVMFVSCGGETANSSAAWTADWEVHINGSNVFSCQTSGPLNAVSLPFHCSATQDAGVDTFSANDGLSLYYDEDPVSTVTTGMYCLVGVQFDF